MDPSGWSPDELARVSRAPELELEFLEPVQIELDGDVLVPQPFNRFRLTALPGAIRILVRD